TRDAQFALILELKRIIAYHDNFRGRLNRAITLVFAETFDKDQIVNRINSELTRLQKFETDVNAADELATKISLAKKFDEDFPLRFQRRFRRPGSDDVNSFAQRKRVSALEVFQNVSIENREWLTSYEKLFTSIDTSLNAQNITVPAMDRLPSDFAELAGAR